MSITKIITFESDIDPKRNPRVIGMQILMLISFSIGTILYEFIHGFSFISTIIVEFIVVLYFLLTISNNTYRFINRIEFRDEEKFIKIFYSQYIFKSFSITIPYDKLEYNYRKKSFFYSKGLVFYNSEKYIASLLNQYKIWNVNTIEMIFKKLKTIKNERNYKV